MKFEPWKTFNAPAPILPIPAPPCPTCLFWRPTQLHWGIGHPSSPPGPMGLVGKAEGVRLCWAKDMCFDFSCYQEKPQEEVPK